MGLVLAFPQDGQNGEILREYTGFSYIMCPSKPNVEN